MRRAAAVEPELVVVADGIDDERVPFPVAYRMSVPRREEMPGIGMLAAVHVDDAMCAGITELVEDVDFRDAFRRQAVDHLPRKRIDARHAHRRARDVRLVLLLAAVAKLLRPWQQRQLAGLQSAFALDVRVRPAAEPWPRQIGMAVGHTRHRPIQLAVRHQRGAAAADRRDTVLRVRVYEHRDRDTEHGHRNYGTYPVHLPDL